MKVLVCGSREWSDVCAIMNELKALPNDTILVHGDCRGADAHAGSIALTLGFTVRVYPADWTRYGKIAGPIRNHEMLEKEHVKEESIDLVLAFHNDIKNSKGTRDMVKRANRAGIEVRVVTSLRP